MPQGPFGIRRFTEVLPFSSDEVEVDVEEEVDDIPRKPPEFERLLSDLNMEGTPATKVNRRIIVKQKPDKSGVDVLDNIKESMANIGERFAKTSYYKAGDVGYIHRTDVDRRIRREGIGSSIRQGAIDDLRNRGVSTVYSFPVSAGGRSLAKSQGFVESDRAEGFMVKEL